MFNAVRELYDLMTWAGEGECRDRQRKFNKTEENTNTAIREDIKKMMNKSCLKGFIKVHTSQRGFIT